MAQVQNDENARRSPQRGAGSTRNDIEVGGLRPVHLPNSLRNFSDVLKNDLGRILACRSNACVLAMPSHDAQQKCKRKIYVFSRNSCAILAARKSSGII